MSNQSKLSSFLNGSISCNLSVENVILSDGNKDSVAQVDGVEIIDCLQIDDNIVQALIGVELLNKFKVRLSRKYKLQDMTDEQINEINEKSEIVETRRAECQFIRYFELVDNGDGTVKFVTHSEQDTDFRFNKLNSSDCSILSLPEVSGVDNQKLKDMISNITHPDYQQDFIKILKELNSNIFLVKDTYAFE